MWQALHAELSPSGFSVVTVALDTDIEAARPFHEAAQPTHPSLVDSALSLVDTFGMTNVPFGVWIDETGTIVRPAEVAFAPPEQSDPRSRPIPPDLSPEQRRVIDGMTRSTGDRHRYVAAVRDWVAKGADSEFVLDPAEVIARSRPRSRGAATAAAEYELGQHLHRAGHPLDAVAHFEAAHRLDPENWSYARNAYAIVDRETMGNPYGTDLLTEVGRVGPETFYPELDL